MYPEAVAVAAIRLPTSDGTRAELYAAWAAAAEASGNHEQRAKCLLALGQSEEAASSLGRRTAAH